MEIGDLHYFAAPAGAFRAPSPRRRRAVALLVGLAAALLWVALLVASDQDEDMPRPRADHAVGAPIVTGRV